MASKKWIACGVSPGMFSDERLVEVNDRTFFVDEGSVRNVKEGHGEVHVTVFEIDGKPWAMLPTNTRETVPLGA